MYLSLVVGFLVQQAALGQFSSPSAHAQNGVDERKHCHFLEAARASMIVASLPPHFWVLPLLCRVTFLSSVFLVVLVTTQHFICLVAVATFSSSVSLATDSMWHHRRSIVWLSSLTSQRDFLVSISGVVFKLSSLSAW